MNTPVKVYFWGLVAGVLFVVLASFFRDRAALLLNVSLWFFLSTLVATVVSDRWGLLAAVAMLGISPSLHLQVNALSGTSLHAWAYPGVDAALGFLAGWAMRGGLSRVPEVLTQAPAGRILVLHAWIAASSFAAVARNLWESASSTSLRGIAYNAWLVRGISWHDDFYPLQDLFFYSAAVSVALATWEVTSRRREDLVSQAALTLLVAICANTFYALWQRLTGLGWTAGDMHVEANGFWPDLHSFAALTALGVVLAAGFLATRHLQPTGKALVGLSMALSLVGLFISGSRSTIVIVSAAAVSFAVFSGMRRVGRSRVVLFCFAGAVGFTLVVLLHQGYRGVSFESLRTAVSSGDTSLVGAALSHRPEIWSAAFRMYSAAPFFGLGQGTFYRLSANEEFSRTEALTQLGGSGVHNYFLQFFVELGPIGLVLALYVFWPLVRCGRKNLTLLGFYGLVGIALGNLYAHSLLVREALMIAAFILGLYLWEAGKLLAQHQPLVASPVARWVGVGVALLACAAVAQYIVSFRYFPFQYGQRCFIRAPLEPDGWSKGILRLQIPHDVATIQLSMIAPQAISSAGVGHIDVVVVEGARRELWSIRKELAGKTGETLDLIVPVPTSLVDWRYLEVRPSRCFVPLNLGFAYEPRRLGVRVIGMKLLDASGRELSRQAQ